MILETFSEQLNERQRQAVGHTTGPLLILAGAGSGKTRVITYRIANQIAQGEATPQQILAMTFTNKAAREMESRVVELLERMQIPVYEPMWIGTFHSVCARILREHIHLLDYQPFFAIYDDGDQVSMIKKIMQRLNINDKVHPPRSFQARINEAKQLALEPDQCDHLIGRFDRLSIEVYRQYEEDMRKANSLDFGDLLFKTYRLFREYPDVLDQYRERFQQISVDEYQDTNHIQYLLVKMLAEKHRNLCVVGDEDQSIYSWRGADITNILSFEKDFPESQVIKLEENYRSTKMIVRAATSVIKKNSQRKDKTLFTHNQDGDLIVIQEEMNEYEEARFVVSTIENLMNQDALNYQDFAIFYRTNAQSRVLEDHLRSRSIPYKIVGGMKFYERMEIKDLLAYLKMIANPADDMAVRRCINTPARGIGKTTIETIENVSQRLKCSFYEAILQTAERREVHSGAARKLREFHALAEGLRAMAASERVKISEIFLRVLDTTEYVVRLKEEHTPEAQARIDNIEEFSNAIQQFEQERGDEASLQNFLEEMALVSDVDELDEQARFVTLMTLHVSKGLEFPVVFIVGLEEGLFPSARSIGDQDDGGFEEERRLMYVGMTRARQKLFLSYARTRRVWGQEQQHPPSPFLREIPEEFVFNRSSIQRPKFLDRFVERFGHQGEFRSPRVQKLLRQNEYDQSSEYDQRTEYAGNEEPAKRGQGADNMACSTTTQADSSDPNSAADFVKGMRVRHPTFGAGTIFQVEGSGANQKVSVLFIDKTFKKFVAKYARLEVF